jgi:hypothetical protein
LNDKVKIAGEIGFVSGFCKGGLYIKNIYNKYLTLPNKNSNKYNSSTILIIGNSSSHLKEGASLQYFCE